MSNYISRSTTLIVAVPVIDRASTGANKRSEGIIMFSLNRTLNSRKCRTLLRNPSYRILRVQYRLTTHISMLYPVPKHLPVVTAQTTGLLFPGGGDLFPACPCRGEMTPLTRFLARRGIRYIGV
jgi:hypothetical protein